MEKTVLAVENVSKTYGDVKAVNSVDFVVREGEIVGLLGPNGAGKSTTIHMVLGVLKPDEGKVWINGVNLAENRSAALEKTNFVAVYTQVPGNLSVYQDLNFFGLLYNVKNLPERIEHTLKEFDLKHFADTKVGVLSSGEQTRVNMAKAMLNKPRLLLLDEPTASLDPSSAQTVRARIKEYAKNGGAVLWTSHNMQEVTEMCDRVLFISHGKVMLQGDPKILPSDHGKKDLEELFITVAREPLSLDI